MRYIFEKGSYPNHVDLDDRELPNDQAAVVHAKDIGADYVWDCCVDRNPTTVWRRPEEQTQASFEC